MVSGRHWLNPLSEEILRRKTAILKSRWSLSWAVLNMTVALSLYFDMNRGVISTYFEDDFYIIWYIELMLAVIFTLNAIFDLSVYLWTAIRHSPLEVAPVHQKLFRITENDSGFKMKTPKKEETSTDHPSPSPGQSFFLPSMQCNSSISPSFLSITPLNYSAGSWASPGYTSGSNLSITSTSWSYHSGSSPVKGISSPLQFSMVDVNDSLALRRRMTSSPSMSFERHIKNEQQLGQYLKEYEEKEHQTQLMTADTSGCGVSNFWTLQHAATNFSLLLRKYQYQPASRSPQSAAAHKDDSPATHTGDVWMKLKVPEDLLTVWIENLRKWLCQTIFVKLASEIEEINDTLRRLGSADLQIGEVSQSTLRQIALTKGQHMPTLSALLPYLDITLNQEYLVRRLKDLAQGGCMSEFKWNSGGNYKGKPWGDDLPTDCAIVMHILCSYMDSRLPPDPHYPDGKTFTSQYFKKTPDKPVLSKDGLCIYQSRITPPHYQIITGEDVWDLPKGRNNLFCSILLFLHHIKTKQCGMLGRVNFGPSGINILWAIDS